MVEMLFRYEPYRSEKDVISVRGVFRASAESDVSKPHFGEFRSGSVGTSFYSLGSPRYLLTEDNRALRDVADHAPYDAVCILVNTATYGGGGIYNLYATNAVDNQWAEYLFIHELGHSFSGWLTSTTLLPRLRRRSILSPRCGAAGAEHHPSDRQPGPQVGRPGRCR